MTLGNGTSSSFGYDGQGRLQGLSHDLSGTASDVSWSQGYSRVGQITSSSRTNDAYAWSGHYNVQRAYTTTALDQYAKAGNTPLSWDGRGNLSHAGPDVYAHDSEHSGDSILNPGGASTSSA
ncbi:hypothetical protein [Sandaracinobacteroides hominis]|uniref:hypothetical protein n=1 Tax=Sandaracinobacteroides hominis TaxID=2780086 RepID=UPI0018F64F10|nr:hypothetical protein [Sandaracinobacteroides hominis]